MVNLGLYLGKYWGSQGANRHWLWLSDTRYYAFYTDHAEFQAAIAPTKRMQQLGCDRQAISVDKAIEPEPR